MANNYLPTTNGHSGSSPSNPGLTGHDSSGATHFDMLGALWRRKWTLVACLLIAAAAATAYLYRATPVYRSGSLVYIERNRPAAYGNLAATGFGRNLTAQVAILQSSTLLSQALDQPTMANASFMDDEQINPVVYLKNHLEVTPGESGDLITVAMESPNPEDNAAAVNAIVQAYLDYHRQRKRSTAAEVARHLRQEKRDLEAEHDKAVAEKLAFQRTQGAMSLGGATPDVEANRMSQLASAVTEARLRKMRTQNALESAEEKRGDPQAMQVMLDAARAEGALASEQGLSRSEQLKRRRQTLRDEIESIKSRLGESHPRVKRLESELNALGVSEDNADPTIEQEAQEYIAVLRSRFLDAKKQETTLRREMEQQKEKLSNRGQTLARYQTLQARIRRTDEQIDRLDARIKNVDLREGAGILDITVLEPATASFNQVAPEPAQTLAISLVLGIMVGLGAMFLQDWLDNRLRSSDQMARSLSLPILGELPWVSRRHVGQGGVARMLADQPDSSMGEAMRKVRTSLMFSSRSPRNQSLLVTSPLAGEGKSIAASNLAIAFAGPSRWVLLIDADFRLPRQHEQYGLTNEIGLTDVIRGDAALDEAIQATDVAGLYVLPSGSTPEDSADLLQREAFADLLARLPGLYDLVVIDASPLLPVADARVIAAAADSTLLVLRAGRADRRRADEALKILQSVGAQVLGVVSNGGKEHSPYAYGYHGYSAYSPKKAKRQIVSRPRPLAAKSDTAVLSEPGENSRGNGEDK